jgi:hypothetical protein
MSNIGSGSNSKTTWIGVVALAALAAFLVVKFFFPQIIEQMAAGIVAGGALLVGLIFLRKTSR